MSGASTPTSPTSPSPDRPRRSFTLPDFPTPRATTPLLPSLLHSPSLISLRQPSTLSLDTSISNIDHVHPHDPLRRASLAMTSESLRSQRLVGTNNRRYQWERYRTSVEDLAKIRNKKVRGYYENVNRQIDRYIWVDQLLDSALVPRLVGAYGGRREGTIVEEEEGEGGSGGSGSGSAVPKTPLRRRPSFVRKMADEETPLLEGGREGEGDERIVKVAIYVNLTANTILLAGKIAVTLLTSSLSVLASLVDSALDFLSTAIIGLTTYLISRRDAHRYPIGRRRLEPIGVLVFAIIMIVSFIQVAVEAVQRLLSPDHSIIQLSNSAITIMSVTVGIKGACYLWCRMVKSSSVQALAQDALTDVYFNTFSILFPLLGHATGQWWLDSLGGLLLSLYVVFSWSKTSLEHIDHLTGSAAPSEDRNLVLYVCMRFARCIRKITGVQAYYSGDKINVEVEVVFDEDLSLKDSHDVAEALGWTVESLPFVERCFVHTDYSGENPTTHLER
ncbi:hypothetical protein TWF106_005646 [Orbilia oligospora]|uniref:Cation efflux protein transmembrane domain-containing protein n=1 Tax=Orbilia oligospora TaxID=2813651 RepID=A0A7C8UND7_ORBOL|nr:hypothetical protein TWF788_003650 [Orbilia oligospora]KAF3214529.1 hypothetical protein TWF679_004896 [Orbilia oligospora]KAF3222229.1 hypothetical protein TWF106_005646 [Orbilia oligospora]